MMLPKKLGCVRKLSARRNLDETREMPDPSVTFCQELFHLLIATVRISYIVIREKYDKHVLHSCV